MLHTYNRLSDKIEALDKKRLKWYTCGPTVYDSAHLGHARTYVSFDIIRRIMEEYFGKHIHYVMNITDIDDKIIKRAAESGEEPNSLARRYEEAFWKDMDALNVMRPTRILRVTESIKEILLFIEILIVNGTAYIAADSSVYFDTQGFGKRHKLPFVPDIVNDTGAEVREGKKHPADFALWKVCHGEAGWVPPWSEFEGRPGWHIECSTMAHMAFGSHFDIHSGGIDLCFPHHANEIAQSMAYNEAIGLEDIEPIKTFWHSGHLHIEGRKMSKSEKNFITIQEAIDKYGSTILRLWFIDSYYSAPIHFSEETMVTYKSMEKSIIDWFARMRRNNATTDFGEPDKVMSLKFEEAKDSIDEVLAKDFDTPAALHVLNSLIHSTNVYMSENKGNRELLLTIGRYVERMFRIFGIVDERWTMKGPSAEMAIGPTLDALADFRTAVRTAARTGGNPKGAVLSECDYVRDIVAPKLGIRMEDSDGKTIWKYIGS